MSSFKVIKEKYHPSMYIFTKKVYNNGELIGGGQINPPNNIITDSWLIDKLAVGEKITEIEKIINKDGIFVSKYSTANPITFLKFDRLDVVCEVVHSPVKKQQRTNKKIKKVKYA